MIVQAAIIQDCCSLVLQMIVTVLYFGDTARERPYMLIKKLLKELGIPITQHSKLA